jgi:signal transduction histidine kinase
VHETITAGIGELQAALLQTVLTLGIALLCAQLYRRHGKPYLGWFTLAWTLYLLRLCAIDLFLGTRSWIWLYWHQVATGWTALALLWAAVSFSRRAPFRRTYLLLAIFPVAWSYLAIYRLDNFLLAAMPAVLFLSAATAGTAWVFASYYRSVRTGGAAVLAVALLAWALHHLDYPFLRARGIWTPWGYYLDIVFTATTGIGLLLLLHDDLRQGLALRTEELERLSRRMVQQHEEERRKLSLHLHDESAQLFTAVKLQLGVLLERARDEAERAALEGTLRNLDAGITSIRNVTNDLRPALLDDLGLLPALRSLASEWSARSGLTLTLDLPPHVQSLPPQVDLALYRALQESHSNVQQHARARTVRVSVVDEM